MPGILVESCPVLRGNDIHIHLIAPENVEQSSSNNYLDAQERSRAQQLILEKDRLLFQSAHIFLRQLLSCYGEHRPDSWQFTQNSYGKPYIANPDYHHLKFNLSHTHGLIAVAIACERELGIDVEQHRHIKELPGLCRYSLSEAECQDVLTETTDTHKRQRFYRYWTMKEAYAKAMGKGLSLTLQNIRFIPEANDQWVLRTSHQEQIGAAISLLSLDYPAQYSLALAAEHQAELKQQPDIKLTHWQEEVSTQTLGFNVFPA